MPFSVRVRDMKTFGPFSVLVLVVIGAAFICLVTSNQDGSFSNPGAPFTWQGYGMAATIKNSKLKDNDGYAPSLEDGDAGKMNLEDYRPIDAVPSSKASVRPGPIKHDTPFMPYIPKPAPPPSP